MRHVVVVAAAAAKYLTLSLALQLLSPCSDQFSLRLLGQGHHFPTQRREYRRPLPTLRPQYGLKH